MGRKLWTTCIACGTMHVPDSETIGSEIKMKASDTICKSKKTASPVGKVCVGEALLSTLLPVFLLKSNAVAFSASHL